MAEVRNSQSRFGGPYMVQDSDHMSGITPGADEADQNGVRQSEQSQPSGRQQGSGEQGSRDPVGGDQGVGQRQSGSRRQSY